MRRRCAIASAAAVVLTPALALADAAVTLDVSCSALTEADRAAFEARARASLGVPGLAGTLVVRCEGREARVTWQPKTGPARTAARPIPEDPTALADALLDATDELATSSAARDRPSPAAPSAEPSPPSAAPEPTNRATQVSERRAPGPAIAIGVGADAAIGAATPTAYVGPHGSVELAAGPALVEASVGGMWGIAPPRALSIRVVDLALIGAVCFGQNRSFELGAGPAFGIVTVAGDALKPPSETGAAFAVAVRGRYRIVANSIRLAFGPEVRFYPQTVEGRIDNERVVQTPTVAGLLTLDVALRLLGGP